MIEVLIVVAVVKASPLGDFGDDVGYCAFLVRTFTLWRILLMGLLCSIDSVPHITPLVLLL